MKIFILSLITFISTNTNFAQATTAATLITKATANTTAATPAKSLTAAKQVVFTETQFDFGQIKQGIPTTHNFVFQNGETTPIVISDVKTTCGCTTPTYPKQPIMQGQKNQINIGYNAQAMGRFQRTIFVSIEGESTPRELVIKGEVIN